MGAEIPLTTYLGPGGVNAEGEKGEEQVDYPNAEILEPFAGELHPYGARVDETSGVIWSKVHGYS